MALAGEQVVGYARLRLSDARPEVTLHGLTGDRAPSIPGRALLRGPIAPPP